MRVTWGSPIKVPFFNPSLAIPCTPKPTVTPDFVYLIFLFSIFITNTSTNTHICMHLQVFFHFCFIFYYFLLLSLSPFSLRWVYSVVLFLVLYSKQPEVDVFLYVIYLCSETYNTLKKKKIWLLIQYFHHLQNLSFPYNSSLWVLNP